MCLPFSTEIATKQSVRLKEWLPQQMNKTAHFLHKISLFFLCSISYHSSHTLELQSKFMENPIENANCKLAKNSNISNNKIYPFQKNVATKKEEKIVNTLKIHDHDLFLFLAKPKNKLD